MAKDARGTKRTCQSSECGSRFYDLNRDPIVCPICGTIYEIAHAPPGALVEKAEDAPRKPKKEFVDVDAEDIKDDETELADVEADEDLGDADDDTFLEDEETDGGDVTNIIGGAHEGDEEET